MDSMGMEQCIYHYLPTWMIDFVVVNVGKNKYAIPIDRMGLGESVETGNLWNDFLRSYTPEKNSDNRMLSQKTFAESEVDEARRVSTTIDGSLGQIFLLILLMEEILHHLGCLKPCK